MTKEPKIQDSLSTSDHIASMDAKGQAVNENQARRVTHRDKQAALAGTSDPELFDAKYIAVLTLPLIEEEIRADALNLENLIVAAKEEYIGENIISICMGLNVDFKVKLESRKGFLAVVAKRVSELSLEIFSSSDPEKIRAKRDAEEERAHQAQEAIDKAISAIRFLEITTTLGSFNTAVASVANVSFPQS